MKNFAEENRRLIEIFFDELEYNIADIIYFFEKMEESVANNSTPGTPTLFWTYLGAFSSSIGKLSYILFSSREGFHKRRAEAIRSILEIDLDNVLANRHLRDKLTHLDEYIDKWWSDESNRKLYMRRSFMPSGYNPIGGIDMASSSGVDLHQLFESYDSKQKLVTIAGLTTSINELIEACLEIQKRLVSLRKIKDFK